MSRARSMRPKWIKGDKIDQKIGRGPNQPMNFSKRDARKWRPKGQPGRR